MIEKLAFANHRETKKMENSQMQKPPQVAKCLHQSDKDTKLQKNY